MPQGSRYSQQFKEDAVRYRKDHSNLSLKQTATNLGVSDSALKSWITVAKDALEVLKKAIGILGN